jgi:anti-anti-sigma factor
MSQRQANLDHGPPRTVDLPTITPTSAACPPAADAIATLASIVSIGALAAVPTAQYASVAWARGRSLIGQAPTHTTVAHLDTLQVELRQGPSLDALREQHVVAVQDISSETRWPVFAARATEAHVGSMLSMPLTVRDECCGVLNLYATQPRAFSEADERSGLEFADRAAIALHRATERDHPLTLVGGDTTGLEGSMLVNAVPEFKLDQQTTGRAGRRPWRRLVAVPDVTRGLRVTSDRVGRAVVVRANGVVDLNTTGQLTAALQAGYTAAAQPDSLVIDLTGIRFLSVGGLVALITTGQQCGERQLTLRVVASHHSVLRPLRITGLDSLFDITSSLADATRPHLRLVKRIHLHRNRSRAFSIVPSTSSPTEEDS